MGRVRKANRVKPLRKLGKNVAGSRLSFSLVSIVQIVVPHEAIDRSTGEPDAP